MRSYSLLSTTPPFSFLFGRERWLRKTEQRG